MADLPRARALLTELLQLAPEDEQLPLQMIANMYRLQLQTPLVRLAALAESETRLIEGARAAVRGIEWQLDFWYSRLEAGKLYAPNTEIRNLRISLRGEALRLRFDELQPAAGHTNPDLQVLKELLGKAGTDEAVSYDALVQLYRISFPGSDVKARMRVLEVELGLSDDVGRMVLDFGLNRSPV